MRWLLIAGSVFVLSCAGVKEIEVHSKENVSSIETLFSGASPSVSIEVKENKLYPLLRSSEWVKVWRGSYFESEGLDPEGWIYLRLRPETPETNF